MNGLIEQVILSRPIVIQHPDYAQKCGFAGARRPHDGKKLSLLNAEVNFPKHVESAISDGIVLLYVNEFDHDVLF